MITTDIDSEIIIDEFLQKLPNQERMGDLEIGSEELRRKALERISLKAALRYPVNHTKEILSDPKRIKNENGWDEPTGFYYSECIKDLDPERIPDSHYHPTFFDYDNDDDDGKRKVNWYDELSIKKAVAFIANLPTAFTKTNS